MKGRSLKAVFILFFFIVFHSCYAKSIVIDNSIDLRGDTLRFPSNHVVLFENNSIISNGVIVSNNNRFKNAKLRNVTIVGEISKIDGCWYADSDSLKVKDFQYFLNSVSKTNSKGYFSKVVAVNLTNHAIIRNNTYVDFHRCTLYKAGGSVMNEGYIKETYDTKNICLENLSIRNKGRQRTIAMRFIGVKNLKIKNLNFYDDSEAYESDGQGDWCMRLQGVDIVLDKINIDNYKSGIWADGIHAERVENFRLTNFNIRSGDDCIAIHNNMNDSIHHITFDESGYCGFIPRHTKNVVVKNGLLCTYMARLLFMGAEKHVDPGFSIEDVSFSNIRTIAGEKGQGIHTIDLRKNADSPIRNIEYRNIKIAFNMCSIVVGLDSQNPKGFDNITYSNVKGINKYPYNVSHFSQGVFLNNAHSVTFNNCTFESSNKYPLSVTSSTNITFKDSHINLAKSVMSPQIYNSQDVKFIGGKLNSAEPIRIYGKSTVFCEDKSLMSIFTTSEDSKIRTK